MPTLLIATTNSGKADEARAILSGYPELAALHPVTAAEQGLALPIVEEIGDTFAANAVLKARSAADASGLPALADDSGLCVDALGGAPGLFSSRWAGPNATDADRIALLLKKLSAIPHAPRTARFVCASALALPGGPCFVEEGICEGVIITQQRGTGGFGYDPVFLLPAPGRTMAELPAARKNLLSHRALSLARLIPHILSLLPKTLSPARLERSPAG